MRADAVETERRPPTEAEIRVIQLVAEGRTNQQIATALHLAENTVKSHLRRLFQEWKIDTRILLIRVAKRHGWVSCPDCEPAVAGPERLASAANALRRHAAHLDALAAEITAEWGSNE